MLRSGCPSSVVTSYVCMAFAHDFGLTPLQNRAMELIVTAHLCAHSNFVEGVDCTVGHRRKDTPRWTPSSIEEAVVLDGQLVQQLLAAYGLCDHQDAALQTLRSLDLFQPSPSSSPQQQEQQQLE
jgi:hypothetical protein